MSIEAKVVALSHDPFNPELNFDCANLYLALDQTASAVSFYLRASEYGAMTHREITYASLIKVAQCFDKMNDRMLTVSNCLLQAMAYAPHRPEAYFFMSQFHERYSQWQECYTMAKIGLSCASYPELPVDTGYTGAHCLRFQQAVSAWWIGRKDESIRIFRELYDENIDPVFHDAVVYNLAKIDALP